MSAEQSSRELPFKFEAGQIRLSIDLRAYRQLAVQKAAYKLATRFTAMLGTLTGECLSVALVFRNGTTEAEAHEAARMFYQELLDQELREQVGEETRPMRALLLAQAFSKTDLIRSDS